MKKNKIILFLMILSICCTSYDEMLEALEKKQGIDKLKKGMNFTTVEEIVGIPYKKFFTEDSSEVWIYITEIPQTTFAQSPDNIKNEYKTTVVFKDKVLIGWGEEYKKLLN